MSGIELSKICFLFVCLFLQLEMKDDQGIQNLRNIIVDV
jgi:hypothetical protein